MSRTHCNPGDVAAVVLQLIRSPGGIVCGVVGGEGHIVECPFFQTGRAVAGEVHGGQAVAAAEHAHINKGDAAGDVHGFQRGAAAKEHHGERLNAVLNFNGFQLEAQGENTVAQGNTTGDDQGGQCGFGKCGGVDGSDRSGNLDLSQTGGREAVVADGLQTLRQLDSGQAVTFHESKRLQRLHIAA